MWKFELTSDWNRDRILECLPSIRRCMQRYVAEFPGETSENFMWLQIMGWTEVKDGEEIYHPPEKQLWVAFTDVAPCNIALIVLSEILTNRATGRKHVEALMCGDHLYEVLPLVVSEIERWSIEQRATLARVIGRFGWIPVMKQYGYRKRAVILEKDLEGVD